MKMSEFFAMDGYAVFVWPSFAITAAVMAWAYWAPWRHHRRLLRELRGGAR
jgi:heme exporter protein D